MTFQQIQDHPGRYWLPTLLAAIAWGYFWQYVDCVVWPGFCLGSSVPDHEWYVHPTCFLIFLTWTVLIFGSINLGILTIRKFVNQTQGA